MKHIDTAYRHVRLFSIFFICGCVSICGFMIYNTRHILSASKDKVYVLANGRLIEAVVTNRNMPVEMRDHVKDFHTLFFTLSPDEKLIQSQITKALYLADESAKKQYQNLKESGYYRDIVAGNISQYIEIDSVVLDLDKTPYSFRCVARQFITRSTTIVERRLITEGRIRTGLQQSDNNNHGFLIERWAVIDNADIKTTNR
ncbi:MAG: conjugative transposon protein TraK [Agriterribacter sp.]